MQTFIINLVTEKKFGSNIVAILGYSSEETDFLMIAFKLALWTWTMNAYLN